MDRGADNAGRSGPKRDRWHRGLADVLWRHRRVIFNPRYGRLGVVVLPHYLFIELLGPVVEALGLVILIPALALDAVDVFALLLFLVVYGYSTLLTLATLLMSESVNRHQQGISDRALMVTWALLENLGYRQLTVLWRLRGLWKFTRGNQDWGAMTRRGFAVQ